ncbi:hypothetical protein AGMMS49960_18730 [Betaproteobacteria bacterium]|nr:hypothetical protein AGMMS49543_25350 [Betaproteobacteria bacterium]GHU03832.1 hypothetical protein AGMMS49960_18730 [Betaproteobacteria bacterium]
MGRNIFKVLRNGLRGAITGFRASARERSKELSPTEETVVIGKPGKPIIILSPDGIRTGNPMFDIPWKAISGYDVTVFPKIIPGTSAIAWVDFILKPNAPAIPEQQFSLFGFCGAMYYEKESKLEVNFNGDDIKGVDIYDVRSLVKAYYDANVLYCFRWSAKDTVLKASESRTTEDHPRV